MLGFAVAAIACGQVTLPSPSSGIPSPIDVPALLVGARWDAGGSKVTVVDLATRKVQVIRTGLQAEPQVIGPSPVSIGVADYADRDLTAARLMIYDYPDLTQLGTRSLPLERRAVANGPGPATFLIAGDGTRAYVIGGSRDGYTQSVTRLNLSTGEPIGSSLELAACGPGFIGYLEQADAVAVICPDPRTVYLLPSDGNELAPSVMIAPDAPQSWVAGAAFGSDDVVICLSSQSGPWRSAFSVLRPDGTVSVPVVVSVGFQAAPNSCSRWADNRTAVGLWDGTSGEYHNVAILTEGLPNETLALDEPVIGPLTRLGDRLVGASGDGTKVLWFNPNGTAVDSLGGIEAAGGLFP
jgi:hypothetical protein